MVRSGPPEPPPKPYPAEKARGGQIILRRPWQRGVFIAGLAGIAIIILVLLILRFA